MKPWLFSLTGGCLAAAFLFVVVVATAPRAQDGSFDIRFVSKKSK